MVATVTREIRTTGQGDVRDISGEVAAAVSGSGLSAGIVTVAVVGSTAGITTIEFEPGAVADLDAVFEQLAPRQAGSHTQLPAVHTPCAWQRGSSARSRNGSFSPFI